MRHLGFGLALLALLASPASAQIITYAAPLPVVAGGTGSTIGGLVAGSAATIGFASTAAGGGACETCLVRDAANTLALKRSGVNSILRVYSGNDGAGYIEFGTGGGTPLISTSGEMKLGTTTAAAVLFFIDGGEQWRITTAGFLSPAGDGTQDIGAAGFRLRTGYFGTSLVIGSAPASALTGSLFISGVTNANLGTPSNNTIIICSDCTIANPCAGGGTGALAKRLNGVWVCN